MKLFAIGLGIGIGFFGACIIAGQVYCDRIKIDFA
jgi:hypothetical protein